MAEDMGPGVEVEVYRGAVIEPPFSLGSRWVVERVYEVEGIEPCDDCLPGFAAPCLSLIGFPSPTRMGGQLHHLCSCSFRPVRRPPPEAATRHLQKELTDAVSR